MDGEDIYFKCACGKLVAADVKNTGLMLTCPDCGREREIPAPAIKLRCECGTTIYVPAGMAGESIQCLACKAYWNVPGRKAEPPAGPEVEKEEPPAGGGAEIMSRITGILNSKILLILVVIAVISVLYSLSRREDSAPSSPQTSSLPQKENERWSSRSPLRQSASPGQAAATGLSAETGARPASRVEESSEKEGLPAEKKQPDETPVAAPPPAETGAGDNLTDTVAGATAEPAVKSGEDISRPAPPSISTPVEAQEARETPRAEPGIVVTGRTGQAEQPAGDGREGEPGEIKPRPKSGGGPGLASNWKSGSGGRAGIQADLAAVMAPFGEPQEDLGRHDEIVIFKDLTYLMDVREALKKTGGTAMANIPKQVNTPGLLNGSFQYYIISKNIVDQRETFNTLIIVADRKGQLVAVQLVNQSPKSDFWAQVDWSATMTRQWGDSLKIYNLIQNRTKASADASVRHCAYFARTKNGREVAADDGRSVYKSDVVCIETQVRSRGAPREQARIYLPVPVVNLVLYYIQSVK